MNKKIALVLGSGGARGFCHIGVIEVLLENNIPIDIVTGCSMGALIGAGFAARVSSSEMREIAHTVCNRTVFDIDIRPRNIKRSIQAGGLARGNRAMRLFKKYAGTDTQIQDCKIPFACIATDLKSHNIHTFKSGDLSTAVRASMSIPGLFLPVLHENKLLVDGGVLTRTPITQARDLGADIIIAVDAVGKPRGISSTSALGILDMSYKLMDWRAAGHEGRDADILITPDLGNQSSLSFRNNQRIIEQGRQAAIDALPQIRKLLNMN